MLALPIFTARRQATIVGVSELNFCVRDGNRWTLTTINTNSHRVAFNHPLYNAPLRRVPLSPAPLRFVNSLLLCEATSLQNNFTRFSELNFFGDPYRIRTDVNGVRGRCLNHLTNGPLVHLQGLEPGTH